MAENQAEDEEDEIFGDFKFVLYSNSNQNNKENDEDWGDFMDNFYPNQDFFVNPPQFHQSNGFSITPNITSQNFDPLGVSSNPSIKHLESKSNHVDSVEKVESPSVEKIWEKPRGAFPLSIFGDEEEESDVVNSSANDDDQNIIYSKQVSSVKNGSSFGSNIDLKDLIGNLYGQTEQIKVENGSNLIMVEENGDFDEDDWEFKVAISESRSVDSNSEVKRVEEDLYSSTIQAEAAPAATTTTTTPTKTGESNVQESSDEGFMLGFSNSAQVSGNWFLESDGVSHNPTMIDNGFHFESGVTTANNYNSESLSQPEQIATENGKNASLISGNSDSDESFWDFKDASPKPEAINPSSAQKEKVKIVDHSGVKMKELSFNHEIQGIDKGPENGGEALPLSIFSDGKQESDDSLLGPDVFSYKPTTSVRNGVNYEVFSSKMSLDDLISNLYSQAEHIPSIGSTDEHTENRFASVHAELNSDLANFGDDFDDFKDAFSESRAEYPSSVVDLGYIDQKFPTESKLINFVDFYSRLKEESCFIVLHHLDGLKNAQKAASLSGDDAKAVSLHEEIQAAYEKVVNLVSEEFNLKEYSPRNICVNEFLAAMKEPKFHVLESEYQLSQRISLAEQNLSSAIMLLEHAVSVEKILTLGSMEEQFSYTTTWSRMISACAEELKHGTLIWKQSLQKNVHRQILSKSQGQQYILALGEIYRVVEVLRVSVTLYRPWILSSLADSMEIFASLEECNAVWSDSGLEDALQSLSDQVGMGYDGNAKALLESITSIHVLIDLEVLSLQNHVSLAEPICRLSVLSQSMVPDMKMVIWNGENYFLTLANFWANLVSRDPPKFPHTAVDS